MHDDGDGDGGDDDDDDVDDVDDVDDDDDIGDVDDDDDDDLFTPEPFTKATTHAFIYMMYMGNLLQPLPGGTPRLFTYRWQHVRPRSMRPTGDPEPQPIPMTHTSLTDMVHSLDEYPKMKSIEKLYVYQAILVYLLNRSGPNAFHISRDHRAMIHTRFLSHT